MPMLHHLDVHVRNIPGTKALFDALAPEVGYELRNAEDDFVSYQRNGARRPNIGFIQDDEHAAGSMRIAFAAKTRDAVDSAARAAESNGARNIEGPGFHPEYGDYYAVFFEDADGNKYEVCHDAHVVL
jgi:catechol 2,3-dioxygenase-like lactoylglutathione lyase family enzyme